MTKTFLKLSLLPLMVLFFFSCEPEEEEVSSDSSSSSDATEKTIHGDWVSTSSYTNGIVDFTAEASVAFAFTNARNDEIHRTNSALSNAIRNHATISAVIIVETAEIKISSSNTITTTLSNAKVTLVSTNENNAAISLISTTTAPVSVLTGSLTFTDKKITYSYNIITAAGTGLSQLVIARTSFLKDEEKEIGADGNTSFTDQYELSEDGNTLTFIYSNSIDFLPEEIKIPFTRK